MIDYKKLDWERQIEILEFYALAQRYGFCTPFCECNLCIEDEEYSFV